MGTPIRLGALELLAKHFGLLTESVEHHGEIRIRCEE
jgi:hypothetical protein